MTVALQSETLLPNQGNKDLLRFITCGSVDDGKSTLIGRLLYDSSMMFEDQLSGLATDSKRYGTTGEGELDLALLVDGLIAEREQGITIDVAYRYFTTNKRKFIVADTPGHVQYTRNMATGASTADLAVLLVDARKGVLTQTRRHSYVVSLLGIRHLVVAVNKMDLIGGDEETFERIAADCRAFAAKIGIDDITCIPVVSLTGENISKPSSTMPWYTGVTLLDHLENVDIAGKEADAPFRMPVQWVNRPNLDYRGFAGTAVRGMLKVGDRIAVLPSGKTAGVARIETMQGAHPSCVAGQAVTLLLDEEVDVSRGDVIVSATGRCEVADQFSSHVVWMSDQPMFPGRRYLVRAGTSLIGAQITEIKYRVDVNTLEHIAAKHLDLNDVGYCNLSLDRPLPFDRYVDNREMGSFILIDRMTNATVGCGMIDFALRRSANIHWQPMKIDKRARAGNMGHKPCLLWFTGLSGAGKSTIADLVEQRLQRLGRQTMSLDGDNVRHGLNRDLGFTDEDRVENIRRVAEVGKLMVDAGLITLVSFISPFRSERQLARDLLEDGEFLEIFVDTPLTICESRDPKGLYKKARAGNLPNFTGVSSPYEPPQNPELRLAAADRTAEELADEVVGLLQARGIL